MVLIDIKKKQTIYIFDSDLVWRIMQLMIIKG